MYEITSSAKWVAATLSVLFALAGALSLLVLPPLLDQILTLVAWAASIFWMKAAIE